MFNSPLKGLLNIQLTVLYFENNFTIFGYAVCVIANALRFSASRQ